MMLYLAIKVAVERKRNNSKNSPNIKEPLPQNRSELYEIFVSDLFKHNEDSRKPLHADRVQIENALTNLFFKLQCRNQVSCKYKEALQIVKKYAEDPIFRKTTSQDILEDSIELGLLRRNNSEIGYGIHQSFQEYFAAIRLKELFESEFDVSEAFSHPKWEEVVLFTSEMLNSDIDEFIDIMLSKIDQKQKYQHELFLASKCVNKASDAIKEKLCALLADKMDSKYELEKMDSIESLGNIGITAISIIAKALRDEDFLVRSSAASALGNIKSETAVKPLINALKDEDQFVRGFAAEALGNIKSEIAVKPLIKALEDENEDVRESAAKALRNIKSEIAVEPLINALEAEFVWRDVAKLFGNIKSETAVKPLIKALEDENEDVRRKVAETLGNIKSETAVKPLIEALKDEDEYVRERAAKTLGNIKSDTAVQPLINALKDENSDVRESAASALENICTVKNKKQLEDLLKSDHEFSANIAFEILYEIEKEEKSKVVLFKDERFPKT